MGLSSAAAEAAVLGSPSHPRGEGLRHRVRVRQVAAPSAAPAAAPRPCSAPPAARAPANFPCLPPARVHTCSWFCGASTTSACSHTLTCPRVAGGCLGHSLRLYLLTPRVPRTANLSLGAQSGLPRGPGSACARLHRLGGPQVTEDAPTQVASTPAQRCLSTAPRPHRSRLTRPIERGPNADRATAAPCVGVAQSFPGAPYTRRRRPELLTLPATSRSCPGGAVSFIHFAIVSMAKENVINPLSATWLSPNLPPFPLFSAFSTTLDPSSRPLS